MCEDDEDELDRLLLSNLAAIDELVDRHTQAQAAASLEAAQNLPASADRAGDGQQQQHPSVSVDQL